MIWEGDAFRASQLQSLRNTIEINGISKYSDGDFVGGIMTCAYVIAPDFKIFQH